MIFAFFPVPPARQESPFSISCSNPSALSMIWEKDSSAAILGGEGTAERDGGVVGEEVRKETWNELLQFKIGRIKAGLSFF